MPRRTLLTLAFLLPLAAPVARATPAAVAELLAGLDVVALVDVRKATAFEGRWGSADDAEAILTRYELQVVERVIGPAPGRVVELILPGGALGERGFSVSDTPIFQEGDRLVVFLDEDRPGHPLVGGERGALRIIEGRAFTLDGRPVEAVEPGGLVVGRPVPPLGALAHEGALEPVGSAAVGPRRTRTPALPVATLVSQLRAFAPSGSAR